MLVGFVPILSGLFPPYNTGTIQGIHLGNGGLQLHGYDYRWVGDKAKVGRILSGTVT